MKEMNFNTLRDLPVPENWIENALAIPEKEAARTAAAAFWKKPRVLAMAASLVLVSVLSVALYAILGNRSPVAIKTPAADPVWETTVTGETIVPEGTTPASGQTSGGMTPTEEKTSGILSIIEQVTGADSAPTAGVRPTENGRTAPTATTNPTESKTRPAPTEGERPAPTEKTEPSESDSPSVDPTEPSDQDSTTAPTEGEIESPTATPWQDPTEPTGEDPTAPTEPMPTQSPFKATINISVTGFTVTRISQDGNVVYCRIYDDDGNSYGDSDRFSDQHIAQMKSASYGRILSYSPRDYGILPEDGFYRFEFYTAVGRLVASGGAYLSAT